VPIVTTSRLQLADFEKRPVAVEVDEEEYTVSTIAPASVTATNQPVELVQKFRKSPAMLCADRSPPGKPGEVAPMRRSAPPLSTSRADRGNQDPAALGEKAKISS